MSYGAVRTQTQIAISLPERRSGPNLRACTTFATDRQQTDRKTPTNATTQHYAAHILPNGHRGDRYGRVKPVSPPAQT